jgi:hypothetical protein
MIIKRTPWTKQPQYPVKIRREYEQYIDSARIYSLPPEIPQEAGDLVGAFAKVGNIVTTPEINGVGVKGSGTSGYYLRAVNIAAQAQWIACTFKVNSVSTTQKTVYSIGASTSGNSSYIGICNGGPSTDNIFIVYRGVDGTPNYISKVGYLPVVGETVTVVASFPTDQTTDAYYYVNGARYNTGHSADGNTTFTTELVNEAVGALKRATAATFSADTVFFTARGFGRIPEAFAKELSKNPWQIFEPQRRQLFIPVAAGGTPTHTSIGTLLGQTAVVTGTAKHITKHYTIGALAGQTAVVTGTATHVTAGGPHTSIGALLGQTAVVAGIAKHITKHYTIGALAGQNAVVTGTAKNYTLHTNIGALPGKIAVVTGIATRSVKVTHTNIGALLGQTAVVTGIATRVAPGIFTCVGALLGSEAIVTGTAKRIGPTVWTNSPTPTSVLADTILP